MRKMSLRKEWSDVEALGVTVSVVLVFMRFCAGETRKIHANLRKLAQLPRKFVNFPVVEFDTLIVDAGSSFTSLFFLFYALFRFF
jgi:hypothetical protein